MSTSGKKTATAFGFLTILRHDEHGLFGGYLLLNPLGRPLEFHCTAPIKPNRAQEILYGPTLDAFLYGEQIGQTLLKQAGVAPQFVCTDREAALAVREHTDVPVVLVLSTRESMAGASDNGDSPEKKYRIDGAHHGLPSSMLTFEVGRNRLAVPSPRDDDRERITDRLSGIADAFDLAEPFGRIRDAIEEAQQAIRC
jgi:hypothetical protein